MRLLICALLLCAACSKSNGDDPRRSLVAETGRLENAKLNEASGLARSNAQDNLYWAVNDDGPADIHALNTAGKNLGRVRIDGARNRDWEDMASFEWDGKVWLLVGDIGDNEARHEYLTLYVVPEPATAAEHVDIAWRIDYRYPNGPRDAEALAVDPVGGHVFVLSKRTVPAELYQVPLQPENDTVVTARFVGLLDSLPQPSQHDLQDAAGSGYGWQPTGMDFAPDGGSLLILTYDGVNYYSRSPHESWPEAVQGRAMHLRLGAYKNAEAIAYATDGQAAIVTVEEKNAPVLRIDLGNVAASQENATR